MGSEQVDREVTAKGVARSSFGALAALGDHQWAPCPHAAHRPTDWRRADGGPLTCGICHPPAAGVPVEAK